MFSIYWKQIKDLSMHNVIIRSHVFLAENSALPLDSHVVMLIKDLVAENARLMEKLVEKEHNRTFTSVQILAPKQSRHEPEFKSDLLASWGDEEGED